MARFDGKVRLAGDQSAGVHAVFQVDNNRLVITAGEHEIGNWHLKDLTVTHRPEGVSVAVEGDELIFAVRDRVGLAEALAPPPDQRVKRTRRPKREQKRSRSDREHVATLPPSIGGPTPTPAAANPQTPRPATSPETTPTVAPGPSVPVESERSGPGLLDRITSLPLEYKAAVAVLSVVALMFVFTPRLLALILALSGAAGLLVGAAAEDPYFGVRMPSWIQSRPTMIAGGILLALGLVVFWIR